MNSKQSGYSPAKRFEGIETGTALLLFLANKVLPFKFIGMCEKEECVIGKSKAGHLIKIDIKSIFGFVKFGKWIEGMPVPGPEKQSGHHERGFGQPGWKAGKNHLPTM